MSLHTKSTRRQKIAIRPGASSPIREGVGIIFVNPMYEARISYVKLTQPFAEWVTLCISPVIRKRAERINMYFNNEKMGNNENIIFEILKNEKIKFESIEIIKNGIPCKGIRIYKDGSDINPVVYFSDQETIEQFMMRVRAALKCEVPNPMAKLRDPDYVKTHVFLALQKRGKEEIVKTEYLNLELFMRVILDLGEQVGVRSVKVTESLVKQLGTSADELWHCATVNSRNDASIRNITEILGLPEMDDEQSLYVATTGQLIGGASILYFPGVFKQFCEDYGEAECYMLPSSTEEILVVRGSLLADGAISMSKLIQMVVKINREQVDPIIQLEPAVYRYSISTDAVAIVATL